MSTLDIRDIVDILGLDSDPDSLWLLYEEQAKLGETDTELEEVYRELFAAIANGRPLTTTFWGNGEGDNYESDA